RLLRRVPIGGTPPWALARLSQSGAVLDRARRRRHPTTDTDGTTTAPRSRTEVAVTGTWVYVTPNAERRDDNRARSPGALKLFGRYGEIVRALPKATGTRGKYQPRRGDGDTARESPCVDTETPTYDRARHQRETRGASHGDRRRAARHSRGHHHARRRSPTATRSGTEVRGGRATTGAGVARARTAAASTPTSMPSALQTTATGARPQRPACR